MEFEGALLIAGILGGTALLILNIWILIVILDAARQASEYFHRENQRHRMNSAMRFPHNREPLD